MPMTHNMDFIINCRDDITWLHKFLEDIYDGIENDNNMELKIIVSSITKEPIKIDDEVNE